VRIPARGGRGKTGLAAVLLAACPFFASAVEPSIAAPGKTAPDKPATDPAAVVDQFLGKYCLECHDSSLAKGDRDFEAFALPLATVAQLVEAKDIIDQVTLREMPPKKAGQPGDEERLAVVRALRDGIAATRGKFETSGGRTVLRRLSSREYENTLATLFGRRVDTLGLTADFPKEKTSRHLDTIGQSLITSGFLLDQYFHAAQRLIDLRLAEPLPEMKTWHFKGHFVQYEELEGAHKAAFNFDFLCLYEQPDTDTRQGGYGHIEDFLDGVPASGQYRIRALARAMHRDTHYDPTIFGIDFSEPFQLAVVPGDVTKGHIHYPQAIEPILDQTLVPDEKFEWLEFDVWLEAGQTPRFIFPNGPYESRASVLKINDRYKDEFKGDISKSGVSRTHLLREGKLPHIRIDEVRIEGPLPEEGGRLEERAVFGEKGFQPDQAMEQLAAFATRAYRRPLEEADRARLRQTYGRRLKETGDPRTAALDTIKLILCSPSFLYLREITGDDQTRLHPYDLATRLSYALWAAPPDDALVAAAAAGGLDESAGLEEEALRLLADDRVDGFIRGFTDSWLNLRELGQMPPPRDVARVYYAESLPEAMKIEVHRFFRDLLDHDRPVVQFLDADFTFVDKRLAKLYGLPEARTLRLADGFQRLSLKDQKHRGGLLGMAAILSVSSNGVETSPVTRGVWVMENILGIEPPPPPDVVPAIEIDVRGATSIRERLEKHRADKACAECHRKIDPLGYSLESFDPIGRYRVNYPKPKGDAPAPKVDPSGEFPSGETYKGFSDFKKLLARARGDFFTRALATRFLSHATGRHMEVTDDYEIEELLARVEKQGGGLRALILECVKSEVFCNR
jgi:hypothetical protein